MVKDDLFEGEDYSYFSKEYNQLVYEEDEEEETVEDHVEVFNELV